MSTHKSHTDNNIPLNLADLPHNCEIKMQDAILAFKKDLAKLNTGRPNPDIVSKISVEAYGAKTLISAVAAVNVPDAKTLIINVWDKSLVSSVEKGIRDAGLGFNPVIDGTTLKIYLPPLTEERRKELAKLANKEAEKFRIEVRNIRRDTLEEFKAHKKDSGVSEDDIKLYHKKVEDHTTQAIKQIDDILHDKVKELESM